VEVVCKDNNIDVTVADYLTVLPSDGFLHHIDSYRRYPIRYVPVADPNNPESIKNRFRDDVKYGTLYTKEFVRKL